MATSPGPRERAHALLGHLGSKHTAALGCSHAEDLVTGELQRLEHEATELRDALAWALHVVAAYDSILPQSPPWVAKLEASRALLARSAPKEGR